MRIRVLLYILLFSLVSSSSAFQFNDLIEKANKNYQQENYQEALNDYLKIQQNGYESAELYYNIGNCFYRLGKIGYAILYYEKALLLNPDDDDIIYNLSIAKAHTVDKINEVPQMFLVEWWDSILSWFTLTGWAIFTTVIYILLIISFGIYFLSSTISNRRLGFYLGVFFLVGSIFSGITLASKYNKENNSRFAVLISNTVTVKQSPNERAADAFLIHEGLKFSIEDELDNWVKIKLPDGKVGWLMKGEFEII